MTLYNVERTRTYIHSYLSGGPPASLCSLELLPTLSICTHGLITALRRLYGASALKSLLLLQVPATLKRSSSSSSSDASSGIDHDSPSLDAPDYALPPLLPLADRGYVDLLLDATEAGLTQQGLHAGREYGRGAAAACAAAFGVLKVVGDMQSLAAHSLRLAHLVRVSVARSFEVTAGCKSNKHSAAVQAGRMVRCLGNVEEARQV
jgi:hypothetical protein